MAQYARPDNDDSVTQWLASTGTDLYACIDETVASDSDYVYSNPNYQGVSYYAGLSAVTDPESSSGHTARWRWKAVRASTPPEKGTITLRQGSTVIAVLANNETLPTDWTAGSYTLDAEEADAITDYTNLNVRFTADTIGASESMQVSWFELEVPNAPGETAVSNLMLLGVG